MAVYASRAVRREAERRLPSLALAAREIEVGTELPALLVLARAEQDEAVRLEELAEVDLGQQAGVARVTGPLEAVDRVRLERVDRRELVDHEHPAARAGDAGELGDHELRPPHVMERPERAGEVERGSVERQARRVALDELRRCAGARSRASSSSSGTRSTPTTSRTSGARASASAPAPQPTSIARSSPSRQDERLHALGQLGGARVLMRGDLAARFARSGPQPSTTTRRARAGSLEMPQTSS